MQKRLKRVLAFLCTFVLVATTFLGNWYTKQAEAATDVKPIQIDGFDNLTLKDFTDKSGNPMPAGAYKSGDGTNGLYEKAYAVTGLSNLDKKLVSMRITYGGGEMQHSLIFGRGDWQGLKLRPSGDGQHLFVDSTWAGGVIVDASTYETPTLNAGIAGVDSFIGKEFLLQMSFEYGEVGADNKADLTLGIYINGKLYNDAKFTIADCNMTNITSGLGVRVEAINGVESIITLDNVEFPPKPVEPEGPAEPIQLEGFDNLTLKDFTDSSGNELPAGEYKSSDSSYGVYEKYHSVPGLANLDKKLVSMRITYGGGEIQHSLTFGRDDWQGFNLRPSGDGKNLYIDSTWAGILVDKNNYSAPTMEAEKAGLDSFIGEEFLLQMSFEYGEVDANNKADLTIGVYINGILYNNQKFTIADCNMDNMTSGLGVRVETANGVESIITLDNVEFPQKPVEPEEPEEPAEPIQLEGFKNLTLKDFTNASGKKMASGAYKSGSGVYERYYSVAGLETLDKTLVSMYITYGGGEYQHSLTFGRADWQGFNLRPSGDGQYLYIDSTWAGVLIDKSNYNAPTMKAVTAGLKSFIGEEFLLQMSFEYGEEVNGKADLTIGVYINGKLYNNEKFTIANCNVANMTSGLGVRVEAMNGVESIITIKNIGEEENPDDEMTTPKQPNESFEKITFEYFGIKDGTYKYDGTDYATAEGKGSKTLDRKVLCGDVLFSGKGENHFMVGGNGNVWYGLRFITQSNGTIVLWWIDDSGLKHIDTFDAMTAGTALIDEWLHLMISTEIIDADGDGEKDDIELGVWFNGVLYREEFYTILNKASGLGNMFGFDCMAQDNSIQIRSIPEYVKGFDYSVYGLTKDWEKTLLNTKLRAELAVCGSKDAEPFTGDLLEDRRICLFGTVAIVALLTSVYILLKRKKES